MKKVFSNEEFRAIERLVIHFYLNNKNNNNELFNSFIPVYNWLYDGLLYNKKQYDQYNIRDIQILGKLINGAKIIKFNEKFFKFVIRRNNYIIIVQIHHKHIKIIVRYKDMKLLITKCNINNKFKWHVENRYKRCSKKVYYMLQEIIYVLTNKFQIIDIPHMSFYYYNRRFGNIIKDIDIVNPYNLNEYIKKNYNDIDINELIIKIFMCAERMIDKNKNPYYVLNLLEKSVNDIIKDYWYRFTDIEHLIIDKNYLTLKELAPVIFDMYLQITLYNKYNNIYQNCLTSMPLLII